MIYKYSGCSRLTSVTIPNSVTSIGYSAFSKCSELTSVTISNSVSSIADGAFYGCYDLPRIIMPNSVTSIGNNAFEGCRSLSTILIPESVTNIGESAFSGCTGLTSVSIRCATVGSWFKGSESIKEVSLGEGVLAIGDDAFNGCSGLASITLPAALTTIGSNAFEGCSRLTDVQFLPTSSLTTIDDLAFADCISIQSIELPASVNTIGKDVFKGCWPYLMVYSASAAKPDDYDGIWVTAGKVEEIEWKDGQSDALGFYNPNTFTAGRISYTHDFLMKSGYKTVRGWESIALPFDVTTITAGKDELVPYAAWTPGSEKKPFWLYELTENGWQAAQAIKANTPYIISMPNHELYDPVYNITGSVTFMGTNVEVKPSDELHVAAYRGKRLVPNFMQQEEASMAVYPLNVNNQLVAYEGASPVEGSAFIRNLRPVYPFEAYLTVEGAEETREVIPLFEGEGATSIGGIPVLNRPHTGHAVYNMQGQKLSALRKGLNIVGGQKVMVR